MRNIIFLFSTSILLSLLSACSDSKTESVTLATAPKLNHRPVKVETNVSVDYTLLDTLISDNVIKLDSIYGHTPYYVKTERAYLFYVCAKEIEYSNDGNSKYNPTNVLLGIADHNCKELLKPQYTKIYNPDATAVGYIEIESNGKRGLFNYKTHEIIPPAFDVIFPSDQLGIDAFGKQGDLYVAIMNGTIALYQGEIPTYISYWQKWEFNIKNKSIKHLLDSYETYYSGDPEYGQGVVFTPSYLFALGFFRRLLQALMSPQKQVLGHLKTKES